MINYLSRTFLQSATTSTVQTSTAAHSLLKAGDASCWLAKPPVTRSDGQVLMSLDIAGYRALHNRLASWMAAGGTWDGYYAGHDTNLKEVSRTSFTQATLASLHFPALDMSTKEPASLKLLFRAPGKTSAGTGAAPAKSKPAAQAWSSSTFSLTIDRVGTIDASRIDPIVIKSPGGFDTLRIWFDERYVAPLRAWFEDFVLMGHNSASQHSTACITYMTSGCAKIASLEFTVGPFSLEMPSSQANQDRIGTCIMSFYVEPPITLIKE